jgi:hypothetical protein
VSMMIAAGGGSTLLFLGSRAYVYHEAILCGVALALWSSYFSLRYLEAPRPKWWVAALITGMLALHARAPAGLFCLGLLGCVAAAHLIIQWRAKSSWRAPLLAGAMTALGLLSLQGVAYLKFGTTNGAPLHYHVHYTPERLARIAGRNFHLSNLRHNLDAYLLWPAFDAGRKFPLFAFDLTKREFPEAKIDVEERTVGILYSMAGLVVFALVALAAAFRVPSLRRPLLLVAAASIPLVGCMLTFIATSHRYTADFCPPLLVAASFGIAFADARQRGARIALLAAGLAASAFACVLTIGLSFHFQVDLVWGVPDEIRTNFLQLRERVHHWFGVT